MTFGKQQRDEPKQHHSDGCHAAGCRIRGSMSASVGDGAKFLCRYHFGADPGRWPLITERLSEHGAIVLGIAEAQGMSDPDWRLGKWRLMERFFSETEELRPTLEERQHRAWYVHRLHSWVQHLTGADPKRPVPRTG